MEQSKTTLFFDEVAKKHKQCWARDPTGKWIMFGGLDTAAMDGFVKDRIHWPAVPILHPTELGYV